MVKATVMAIARATGIAMAVVTAMAMATGMDMTMAGLYFVFVEHTSHAWEARAVIIFLAILMATVIELPRRIADRRQQVPAIPTFAKPRTPFPILPAILLAAAGVGAQGNDIEDALARSPAPSRKNSLLPWLPEIVA